MSLEIESDGLIQGDQYVEAEYQHKFTEFDKYSKKLKVLKQRYNFKTETKTGKVGLLMVGFGGNNGSTILGGLLANKNKLTWQTKKGQQCANMLGSMTQSSTMKIAETQEGEVFLPIKQVFPLLDPTELVVGGWDISSANMSDAMKRAQVFEYELQQKLWGEMSRYKPMKSIYYSDFIASNQSERADNILEGDNVNKLDHLK